MSPGTQTAVIVGAVLLVGLGLVVVVSSATSAPATPPTTSSADQGSAERIAGINLATEIFRQGGTIVGGVLANQNSGTKQGVGSYPGAGSQYASQTGGGIGAGIAGLLK